MLVDHKSEFLLTQYLALTNELWSVSGEDLGENWPRFNGIALYMTRPLL